MEYEVRTGSVEVTVTKQIIEGVSYRINSSYGYAGIDSDLVEVKHVIPDASNDSLSQYPFDIHSGVEGFIEAELSLMDKDSPEYEDANTDLRNNPWIVSTYNSSGDTLVLPLRVFIDHISVQ